MYIIILGGDNDSSSNLSNYTLIRLEKFYEIYNNYKNLDPKIIISGGFRFSQISHSSIIKKIIQNKYPNIIIEKEFIENNDTIDEALNLDKYLKNINYKGNIKIITSNWHMNRVKYLFGKVFEIYDNLTIEFIETNENEIELEKQEKIKLYNLKHKPYGKWKEYILKHYIDKKINIEFIKKFGYNNKYENYIKDLLKQIIIKLFIKNEGIHEKLVNFEKLWIINKYIYQNFITKTIGKIMNVYDFDSEYSTLINNKICDYNIKFINDILEEKGVYITEFKIDRKSCNNIINNLNNKFFKPFGHNSKILGEKIIGKNIINDDCSTFWINNQNDILSINEVQNISKDPLLLKIVQEYLGCKPFLCQTNLWYTSINKLPERTQKFHQDYDDINFLKIFIYLTDVSINNGPHCYIEKSLNNMIVPENYKPSIRLTDDFVNKNYKNNIKIITGEAGTIIIENTNGFHKGMPVKEGSRLILQLQYCSTPLPLQQGCPKLVLTNNNTLQEYLL